MEWSGDMGVGMERVDVIDVEKSVVDIMDIRGMVTGVNGIRDVGILGVRCASRS